MSLNTFMRRLVSRRVLSPRKRVSRSARLGFEELENRCLLTDFVVGSSTCDKAWLSLFTQINKANVNPGLDRIVFQIQAECAVDGIYTLKPEFAIQITDPLTIDGTTQAGFSEGHPVIELDGSQAGPNFAGLEFHVGGNLVKGLIIHSFPGPGIVLDDSGLTEPLPSPGSPKGGSIIVGNFIGTDASGKVPKGNDAGILLVDSPNNTIGGKTEAERNIISGNRDSGIFLDGGLSTGQLVQ